MREAEGMKDQIKITKEVPIIIYGGGEVGSNCYKRLKGQGYCVAAALDQNKGGEHVIEGLYTYKLGTEPAEWDRTNCIVMICLADGMIHKAVADRLYSMGYSYILFLPMQHSMADERKRQLTRIYNAVLSADSAMTEGMVSNYSRYISPDMDRDCSMIRRTSVNITVWMRLEMLFSESLELWQGDKTKMHTKAMYKDRNIACGNPCEALFDYYSLRSDSYDIYFDSKKEPKTREEKEKELRKREELYRVFQREYEKGMDFFVEGAPEAVWNPKGYCNLAGGHHRTLYLLHKGHNLFPVKMKYDDFDKWYHEETCHELMQYLCDNHIEQFYAPLPHPCFLNFPVQWEDAGRTKLADVMRMLADENSMDMTVLDCSNDEGYYARNMDRIGAEKSVFLNQNVQQAELADLMNRLLYRQKVIVVNDSLENYGAGQKFDLIFGGSIQENSVTESRMELLGILCRGILLMETTQTEEIKKIQFHTRLKKYKCLHREYRFGQVWELGAYSR